jgi:regulator of sirC expression with transglutaminase-like and TPR domain
MEQNEIKALISLLDDEDREVVNHVETKILSFGEPIIPFLENEWGQSMNPTLQNKLEELIRTLQLDSTKERLRRWKNSENQDLLEGLWAIATYQYPELSLEDLREKIQEIYVRVWTNFQEKLHPYDEVRIINNILFDEIRFMANVKNFHSPSNSMLNAVLESKRGNPISLCMIYLLVAQKLKMPVYGVNLPNHFILMYKSATHSFYINAFNKGLVFSKEDIDNYISQLKLESQPKFYEPCTNLDIIRRVLRNLYLAFEQLGEANKMQEIEDFIAEI